MAEHRITARLDYQTQSAERNLERLLRMAEKVDRQMRRLHEVGATKMIGGGRDQMLMRETRELEKQARAYEKLGQSVERTGRMQNSLSARPGGNIMAGAGRMFGAIATSYVAYKAASAAIQTITEEETLRNYIKTVGGTDQTGRTLAQLGGTIGKSRTDLLRGGYQALSSGVQEKDVSGLVQIAGKASVAGGPNTSVEGAVDVFTSIAQAYKKNGQADFSQGNITKISDQMFKAVELGKVEFSDLQQNLGEVLSAGAVTGVPVEQLLAALTTASLSGVKTPEATTALKQMLLSIAAPTPQAEAQAKKLGIDLSAENIKKIGLPGVLKEIAGASKNNIKELNELFPNVRALTGFLTQFGNNAGTFDEVLKKITNSSGSTDKAFQIMSKGVENQWQTLKNSTAELVVAFADGTGILTGLSGGLVGLKAIIQGLTGTAPKAGDAERIAGPTMTPGTVTSSLYAKQIAGQDWEKGLKNEDKFNAFRKLEHLPAAEQKRLKEGKWGHYTKDEQIMMQSYNELSNNQGQMMGYNQWLAEKKLSTKMASRYDKVQKGGALSNEDKSELQQYLQGGKQWKGAEQFSSRLAETKKEASSMSGLSKFVSDFSANMKDGMKNLKQMNVQGQTINLSGAINLGSLVGGLLSGNRGAGGDKKTGVAGVLQSFGLK